MRWSSIWDRSCGPVRGCGEKCEKEFSPTLSTIAHTTNIILATRTIRPAIQTWRGSTLGRGELPRLSHVGLPQNRPPPPMNPPSEPDEPPNDVGPQPPPPPQPPPKPPPP